ncbi:hypothetical protein GGR27_003200 [Lewinella antarctica]|uniref:Uncharacterized protein n=1 Tax=Neolewinella antarctica TaxID=442734 RepID=A0ABX0XEE1_9BACT|nr:hypothetical protein [Neolewinella antarctica]
MKNFLKIIGYIIVFFLLASRLGSILKRNYDKPIVLPPALITPEVDTLFYNRYMHEYECAGIICKTMIETNPPASLFFIKNEGKMRGDTTEFRVFVDSVRSNNSHFINFIGVISDPCDCLTAFEKGIETSGFSFFLKYTYNQDSTFLKRNYEGFTSY